MVLAYILRNNVVTAEMSRFITAAAAWLTLVVYVQLDEEWGLMRYGYMHAAH